MCIFARSQLIVCSMTIRLVACCCSLPLLLLELVLELPLVAPVVVVVADCRPGGLLLSLPLFEKSTPHGHLAATGAWRKG